MKTINYFSATFIKSASKLVLAAIVSLSVSFMTTSCGGGGDSPVNPTPENPSTTKSSACLLSSFSFQSASNSGLTASTTATISYIRGINMVLITVPTGYSLAALKPTFKISDKASIKINGTAAESASTSFDFTNTATAVITAENGTSTKSYKILVRNGNAAIDKEVYGIMATYGIPGMSVATTKNEVLVYSAGYGFAIIDGEVRTTPNMLFRLASVSKQQTALCIMTLVEEGKLSLDDYIFAPADANGTGSKEGVLHSIYSAAHASGVDKIKIRHLLSHTTGWQYATTGGVDPIFTGDSRFYGKSLTERAAYMANNVATTYTAGSYYSYYNLDYCLLGEVIEKVTGKDYETFLRSIVAKAGATDIWVAKTAKANKRDNEVVYYSQTDGNDGYGNDMEVIKACGGVIASAPELMEVMCSEDYGTVVPDILKTATLDQLYKIVSAENNSNYAFGWRIGHSTLLNWAAYHGGNISGTASIWVRGKNGVNGVMLCNSRSNDDNFDTALYVGLNDIMSML